MAKKSFNVTIIGGGGYIGFHIGIALKKRGHHVTLFDIRTPDIFWIRRAKLWTSDEDWGVWDGSELDNSEENLRFLKGSLLNQEELDEAITGANCVIHCASYGMSGLEQMPTQWTKTEEVNITGTENVLNACRRLGVQALVYTSSFNVVFGGQEIVNGDESLPYFPLHLHVDHYSRTKAIAERLVLYSDGISHNSQEAPPLRTCALRLAGVIGLGEQRHLPRIVDMFGLMFCTFSYGDLSLQQFLTVRNVAQAHVKAAEQLVERPEVLGGQPYFISDGEPVNTFQFFQPLREALGYRMPLIRIPIWLVWFFVYVIQFVHCILSAIHPRLIFAPLLTPAEVFKTAQTHYFSNDKAKRDFGYEPENPNDISDVINHYCEIKSRPKPKKYRVKFPKRE